MEMEEAIDMARHRAEIGSWFEEVESGQIFEIVALDELQRTIEVQYLDGSLGEFDSEQWRHLPLVPAAPPEDANAAYEPSGDEPLIGNDAANPSDGNSPLDQLEGDSFIGTDEFP
jgi:hypothetical protein